MKTIITDLSGIKNDDIICSIKISPNKKWLRIIKDNENNEINIHKLKVERSLNSSKWILCLYNIDPNKQKHVFYLDLNKTLVRKYIN